jgi:threonine/homoserine/homoserine lactone efflux protein
MVFMTRVAEFIPHLSGFLQWFFVGLLVTLVGLVGVFFLFVATQLFRNPGRRSGPSR